VDKFIVALQVQLDEKKVHLHIDASAVSWLVTNGYNESMGARPMARLIQEKLKKKLAEDILFGSLADNGGDVYVSEYQDDLKVDIKKFISNSDKKEPSKTKI
ncbi:MAG: ATP-dependent Clp protease ATP-binding subunit ClpA, partial [Gammaproteobacteria bacterium]|nr:ATP-dependent Clp protease ATP-binding subunit ClpA [Gammaproteobacteria bacterium]